MKSLRLARQLFLLALILLLVVTGASAGLQIVWGPVLGDLTTTSAQLTWYTSAPSYGEVRIAGQSVARGGPVQAHKVMLSGLQPGATYYYSIYAEADGATAETRKYRLTTPAAGLSNFTLGVYGDTRSDPAAHAQVVRALMALHPDAILHTGDLVSDGSSVDNWHHFFPVIARYSPSVPLYPCLGNHEGDGSLYFRFLPLPAGGGLGGGEWYTAVYGSVQIIVLDSSREQATQGLWLHQLLTAPRPPGVLWRIVEFHNPPYTSGPHPGDPGALKYWCPDLERGAVDLVVSGHNHYYERSLKSGLNYLTVGGGGAPLYDATLSNPYRKVFDSTLSFVTVQVSPTALQVTAWDTHEKVLDRFTVAKR
ncbi:MAG TPA: metallophosphoesterase family protein [Armatimonadota bacterium]|jgi:hypothetical protein